MVIAFLPVAFGYGTAVQCLAVAEELRRRGHRCVFLAGESLRELIARHEFTVSPVPDVVISSRSSQTPARQLLWQESAPGFLHHQLAATVLALRQAGAGLVIFSHSLTGALAAGILGLPSLSIFQPAILDVRSADLVVPMLLTWLRFLLLRAQSTLAKPVSCLFLGDRSFIPSIPPLIRWPWLVPPELAAHRDEVEPAGALLTQDPDRLPPRGVLLEELLVEGTPFVYGTLGGAIFDLELSRAVALGIREAGCHGLVSGGSVITPAVSARLSGEGVRVVRFVPDDLRAIKAADVLIWHGGHATLMEAVACGTPVIGLPYQLDQFANVDGVVRFGAGLRRSPRGLTPRSLAEAIRQLLRDARYRERMATLQQVNRGYGGAALVADAAEALVGRPRVLGAE